MRFMRVVAFDWRMTVINSILLICGVIIHVLMITNNYSKTIMPTTDLGLVQIIDQVKSYDQALGLISNVSDIIKESMVLRSSLVTMSFELHGNMTNSNGKQIDNKDALANCANADCSLYDAVNDKLSKMKNLLRPLERKIDHSLYASISIPGFSLNSSTINGLRQSQWLPTKLTDGILFVSLLFRTSMTDDMAYQTYFIIFDIDKASVVVNKNVAAFKFNIGGNQSVQCIGVILVLALTTLLYIIKYFAKSSFLFSQYFLFYGALYIGTLVLTLAASGQHRSAVNSALSVPSPSVTQVADLYYTDAMARLSLFFVFCVMAIEVIKVLVYAKRFKRMRDSALVVMRSVAILIKCLLFLAIIIVIKSFSLSSIDGVSNYSFLGLVTGHSYWPVSDAGYHSALIRSMSRLFDTMANIALIAVVFVCINNAENLEYEGDDRVTSSLIAQINGLTTKSLKFIDETTNYIELINKKKVCFSLSEKIIQRHEGRKTSCGLGRPEHLPFSKTCRQDSTRFIF